MPPFSNLYFAQSDWENLFGIMATVAQQIPPEQLELSKYRKWCARFGFSSGLATTDCLMRSFKTGDRNYYL
jgi:hypothetical protein